MEVTTNMKKYLLVWACGDGDPELYLQDIQAPIPCANELEVSIALETTKSHGKVQGLQTDWALFELVNPAFSTTHGRYERRAITFKTDGRTIEKIG
jgi:hypothetical protein